MPNCGCFHHYTLTPAGLGQYTLESDIEGTLNLGDILERAGVVGSVSSRNELPALSIKFPLSGVPDEGKLRALLELLRSTLVVDLSPQLHECYALGPYTVFQDEKLIRTDWGNRVNKAKYWPSEKEATTLGRLLDTFIQGHPTLRTATAIVAPPKGDSSTPDLPLLWAQSIAQRRNCALVLATKSHRTSPQKALSEGETEDDAAAKVANTVEVPNVPTGARVLVLDDTIRSGGTLREVARSAGQAGASEVYGLAVAKDAKFTTGGVSLAKDQWEST